MDGDVGARCRKVSALSLISEPLLCTSGMDQRINVNLPQDVHRALRVYCVERGLTMAEVIIAALKRLLAEAADARD